jgi:hypothetical protein
MSSLTNKIRTYLGRNVDFQNEIQLRNDSDGKGDYIFYWSDDIEKSKPTDEQLNALESQADELETANQVISNRKAEYPTIEECVHAILDDDLENLQILRQAVKNKFPKNE